MAHRKIAKHITIEGVVQGVGFRPHVYRLAKRYGIGGGVRNAGGGVSIWAEGPAEAMAGFVTALEGEAPPSAHIERLLVSDGEASGPEDFAVQASGPGEGGRFLLPDLPTCPRCAEDVRTPGRRNRHFFNTCTHCGPRYSILEDIPYDRRNTAMSAFEMCRECGAEYRDPDDRRFHAETVCCPECGPELLYRSELAERRGDAAFAEGVDRLKNGGILLIKGIGGYHLACRPDHAEAVAALRAVKGRDAKPFAVMFADTEQVKLHCRLSDAERELLLSPARPIVPLRVRSGRSFAPETLKGDIRCGCFLPYTPLHLLLLEEISPLVMTSANPSGSPIIFDDATALAFWEGQRDRIAGILFHRRAIVRPVEDSVAAVIGTGETQILRRSRGYAPAAITLPEQSPPLLAAGGDLKSSFCLAHGDRAYMSQYLGDLEDADALVNYRRGVEDMQRLLAVEPRFAVCDAHPGYHSSALAGASGLPVIKVQHHHAHIASVMAEMGTDGPVIGAAFDGTGYGDDGAIWGGEFLICDGADFRRAAHLNSIPLVGGDQAARDAGQTAACHLLAAGLSVPKELAADTKPLIAVIANGMGAYPCSSMGRLFDAVAAILGVCRRNRYEGQCAVALQQCAETAQRRRAAPVPLHFSVVDRDGSPRIGFSEILRAALACPPSLSGAFALGFHLAVAEMLASVFTRLRKKEKIDQAALSGGVFQNALLLDMCRSALAKEGFSVHCNRAVPPNDGGIALGQALIGARLAKERNL